MRLFNLNQALSVPVNVIPFVFMVLEKVVALVNVCVHVRVLLDVLSTI